MSHWIYRATETGADETTTAELLDEGFLCAQVCKAGGMAMPRVRDVDVGHVIHVLYRRKDDSVESLGSFRIVGDDGAHATMPLPATLSFSSVQRAVAPGSELEKLLVGAGYERDPHLRSFTGWLVEPIASLVSPPPDLFEGRGRNSLFAFDPATGTIVVKDEESAEARGGNAKTLDAPDATRRNVEATSSPPVVEAPPPLSPAVAAWPASPGARAVGLDWSGGKEAGKKIWQAHLAVETGGRIVLSLLDRPFLANPDPSAVRAAFANWFAALRADVVGMDFCFGLEASHSRAICAAGGVAQGGRVDPLVLGSVVTRLFVTPGALREACRPERKRKTDKAAGAPFAPTNLRMFRQTWLGLTCLATLPSAVIAPWASSGAPVLVEVLPARIVRSLGIEGGYKGRSEQAHAGRERLASTIERLVTLQPSDRRLLVEDVEGDAIDAILAGLAALRAHHDAFAVSPTELEEGWIF